MEYKNIKELRIEKDTKEVNKLIKNEWILVMITSIQNEIVYLLGRI